VVLFSLEHLPTDVIALGILLTLALTDLLPPDEIFAGFGSDTVVMIFGLLVLTAALVRTGVVDMIGSRLLRMTGEKSHGLLGIIMGTTALLSAFISNTATTTALFVPLTISLARRARISASRLLMPLAFASILASSVTLISSSTNIVVSGIMSQHKHNAAGDVRTDTGRPSHCAGRIDLHAFHRSKTHSLTVRLPRTPMKLSASDRT
jgi:di/tricarboxylate transporter